MKKRVFLSARQLLAACGILAALAGIAACFLVYELSFRRDEKLFQQITSQLFEEEMKSSTLNMHYNLAQPDRFGISDYEAVLPVYSPEKQLASQVSTQNTLELLTNLDESKLSGQDAFTYRLLIRSLENALQMSAYPYYDEPLSPSSGMQSQLPILLAEYTFRTRRDVEDYLALLDQTDEYFASLLQFEQEKAQAGLLMPASSLEKVKKQCDTIVSKKDLAAGTHFLQTTFQERLQLLLENSIVTEQEAAFYLAQNDRLLTTVMQPAYEALADGLFVLEDASVTLTGLGAKPLGKAYYGQLLIAETGSYRSVTEITQLLTARFQEECAVIRTIATEHPDVVQQLSSEALTAFPYESAEDMLGDLQVRMEGDFPALPAADEAYDNSRQGVSAGSESGSSSGSSQGMSGSTGQGTSDSSGQGISGSTGQNLPSVTVKEVSPSLEQYTAPAFYLTTPIDDTDNNVIYINHKNSPSGLELYTTLAHEGYPGHLYQTVYSNRTLLQNQENKARQLLWYGGYLEGWALYVEFTSYDYSSELMQEQNRETDAVRAQLEKHNRSLQLCLYSLLDIMIHYENASYSQVSRVLQNLGVTNSSSISAIYTYITEEPCNYLKYYVGYLEIEELKKAAKEHWGDAYSDYAFHKFYLDCGPADFSSLGEQLQQTTPALTP